MVKSRKNLLFLPFLSACIVAALSILPISVFAKSMHTARSARYTLLQGTATKQHIKEFEKAITPYFIRKAGMSSAPLPRTGHASLDQDVMLIARFWNRLSRDFKELYLKSLSIPAGFHSYTSPTGNFEIYYTTSGNDAVAPEDAYGYSSTSWRTAEASPNGTPDYIDEIAWALDSAWSMEIERFEFQPPYAITDKSHASSRYKVVVCDVRDYDNSELYGMTYPAGQADATTGLRSYMEIRNDWSLWNDYRLHPFEAAHITCAHEFFHAIQYAMGHATSPSYIDYFPGAWLEATAVLMEELAFDHVNDYIQYVKGFGGYFTSPQSGVLLDGTGLDPYTNGIVAMYLYRHALDVPSIFFIHAVFAKNQQKQLPFVQNLESTSAILDVQWPNLLNRFHTASFFTGARADTARFLPDASLLPAWNCLADSLDDSLRITKSIGQFALQTFVHERPRHYPDTLHIQFAAQPTGETGKWAASIILKDTSAVYSVHSLLFESHSAGHMAVTNWGAYSEAIVVATNGNGTVPRNASVYFTGYQIEDLFLSQTFDCYPNPVMKQQHGICKIRGRYVTEISIYSIDGDLIAYTDVSSQANSAAFAPDSSGFDWNLRNASGKSVVPGTYIALVGYKDVVLNKLRRKRKSILVLP
jgi:hypothetical protein